MSKTTIRELEVNGETYVLKSSIQENAPSADLDGMPYVIIRSRDSGCHAGYVQEKNGREVTLIKSRRLWYWSGAATLSQLALEGVKNPSECKFVESNTITIFDICEIQSVTRVAQESIESITPWKQ